MADYSKMTPPEVWKLIRTGEITRPTAGMCAGYAQANLVILPKKYADDFKEFARKNPKPCPILEVVEGTPDPRYGRRREHRDGHPEIFHLP